VKLTKIVILDRGIVINLSFYNNIKDCIGDLKYFKWVSGAIKTIKYLKENEFKVVVVTNQPEVARGFLYIFLLKLVIHMFYKFKN
jgi:histidinol phosphatase-like enzyme